MYCNQCGMKNLENARFCSRCGERMTHAPTDDPIPAAKPITVRSQFKSNAPRPTNSSMQYVQPATSSWKTPMFLTFGLWALSAILLFCNWFKLDIYIAKLEFSVFSLNKATSQLIGDSVYDNSSSLETLNIFVIVSSVLFLLFLVSTVALFFVQKKGMFTTGIILSALLIIFTVIVMIAYFSATGSEDLAGLVAGAALEMTIAPYLLLVFVVLSIVSLLISRDRFCKTAPKTEKPEKQVANNSAETKQKFLELISKAKQWFSSFLKKIKPVFQKIVSSKIFISIVIIAIILIIVIAVVSEMSCASQNKSNDNAYYLESNSELVNIENKTLKEIIPVVDKFVESQIVTDYSIFANLYNEDILNSISYTKYSPDSNYGCWSEFLREGYVDGSLHDYAYGITPYAWSIRSADYTYLPDVFITSKDAGINITNAISLTLVYSFEDDSECETSRLYDHNGREFWNSNSFCSRIELVKVDSEWYMAYGLPVPSQELDDSSLEHYENLFWDSVYSDLSEEDTPSDDSSQKYDANYEEYDYEYTSIDEDIYFDDIEFYDSYDSSWGIDYDTYQELVSIAGYYVLAVKHNDIPSLSRLFSNELLQYSIQQNPDEFEYDNWEDILYNRDDGFWYINYENLDYLGDNISEWTISYAEISLYSEDDRTYVYDQTGIDLRGSAAIYIDVSISDTYYEDAMYIELCKIGSEWYVAE